MLKLHNANPTLRWSVVALLWAVASAVTATALLMTDSKTPTIGAAVVDPNVWKAAVAGLLVSGAWAPLLTASWNRWYWSGILGLPIGGSILYGFFFLNPSSWQTTRLEAWKSVGMCLSVWPHIILPACVAAGALCGLIFQQQRTQTG